MWGDKNNATIMNDLQVMQNKAAKIILDRPFYSSATDALTTLKRLNLGQRRHYHRWLYIFKCINKLSCISVGLLTHGDVHGYNTRHKDVIRLPLAKTNWDKHRLSHHAVKEWNNLNDDIRSSASTSVFKRRMHKLYM